MNAAPRIPRTLCHPRHWPSWALIYLLWLVTLLPHRVQLQLGQWLGALLYLTARQRRHVARTNVRLCFPELDQQAQAARVKEIFRENGIGLVETATAWFTPPSRFRDKVRFDGLEHLEQAMAKGRGVLLLGGHYTTLDIAGNLFTLFKPVSVIYRAQKNPVFEYVMTTRRSSMYEHVIDREDMRSAIRCLKRGNILWYAPDQDYGRKHSVFAPFFGIPAASITATARILSLTHATPVIFSHYREGDRYVLRVEPVETDLTSLDDEGCTAEVNRYLERCIRRHPSQYMWVHRRFKTRPEGSARVY